MKIKINKSLLLKTRIVWAFIIIIVLTLSILQYYSVIKLSQVVTMDSLTTEFISILNKLLAFLSLCSIPLFWIINTMIINFFFPIISNNINKINKGELFLITGVVMIVLLFSMLIAYFKINELQLEMAQTGITNITILTSLDSYKMIRNIQSYGRIVYYCVLTITLRIKYRLDLMETIMFGIVFTVLIILDYYLSKGSLL